eukprot:6147210-Alexandrium_andersonii.AAC.1
MGRAAPATPVNGTTVPAATVAATAVPIPLTPTAMPEAPWPDMGQAHGAMAVSYTHLTLPTICSV